MVLSWNEYGIYTYYYIIIYLSLGIIAIITLHYFFLFVAVALGWNALAGCELQDAEGVEVWPLKTLPSRIPVAGSVTLVAKYVIERSS